MRTLRWIPTLTLLVLLVVSGVCYLAASAKTDVFAWTHGAITQTYGHNYEHGVDVMTYGRPISALLAGTITFDRTEDWGDETVQDITWRLDKPWIAKGFHYAYVQILAGSSFVHVGEHIQVGTLLGLSGKFIEFGLTHSDAYGVHGDWSRDWTTDPRFLLWEARA